MKKTITRRSFLKGALSVTAVAAVSGLSGCTTDEKGTYTPGTYSAEAQGMGTVKVSMTFDSDKITDVQVDVSGETPSVGGLHGDELAQAILDSQGESIDAVTGATITSKAVAAAASACISQAKGETVEITVNTGTVDSGEPLGDAEETYETDVVIAGAGAAGLMAALNLARAGRKVMILEACSTAAGSNFSMCGGPAACETKLQAQEGEDLSVDKLFKYMYGFSQTAVNGKLLKKVLACTGKAVDDMMDLGVEMELWPDVYKNGFRARHYILPEGAERVDPIVNAIEEAGGTFIYNTKAKEPVMTDGKVTGIKALSDGKVIEVDAKAVLICTGGFIGSTEMQKKYLNTPVFALGNTSSDGSGIELVHKAGGVDDRTFAVLGNECGAVSAATTEWPFTEEWLNKNEHYGYWLFGGLYTDPSGERFINEEKVAQLPLAIGGEAMVRQGRVYCVMDSDYYNGVMNEGIYAYLGEPEEWGSTGEEADYYKTTPENAEAHLQQAIEEGWAWKADTIKELADKFNLPELEATVEAYNGYCDTGEDTEFYKPKAFLKAVKTAPFYIFEYVPSAWGTNGGVKVNAHLQALDEDNQAIEGLYAAGVDTGSMYTQPYYDNPGSSVGLALGSGVLAAQEIDKYLG